MEFEVDIRGIEGLLENMERLAEEYGQRNAESAFRAPLKNAATPALNQIKANTPVDSGGLESSARISITVPNARRIASSNTVDESTALEARVGWLKRRGDGTSYRQMLSVEFGNDDQPAQPVIRPAFESNARQMQSTFESEVSNAVERTAKRLAARQAKGTLKIR